MALYGDRIHPHVSPYDAAIESDAIVIMTEWNDYRHLDLKRLHAVMRRHNFVDFRLLYTHDELSKAGFNSYVLGNGFSYHSTPKATH